MAVNLAIWLKKIIRQNLNSHPLHFYRDTDDTKTLLFGENIGKINENNAALEYRKEKIENFPLKKADVIVNNYGYGCTENISKEKQYPLFTNTA